jgi:hypothetical protein
MEINLATVLDEVIVLHTGVATKLLKEFPDAFGATFMLDAEPAFALPKHDVPPEYASEYGDQKFEERSKELMVALAPRMLEIVASVAPLGITLRDFSFSAQRADYPGVDQLKEAVDVLGAISGGLGAVRVLRAMLAANDRILVFSPSEFHVLGIVDDVSALPAIHEASSRDLLAALDHLADTKLLLNAGSADVAALRGWVSHFPGKPGPCEIRSESPVCRLVSKSDQRKVALYVEKGDIMDLDTSDGNMIIFDPERGFDTGPSATAGFGM